MWESLLHEGPYRMFLWPDWLPIHGFWPHGQAPNPTGLPMVQGMFGEEDVADGKVLLRVFLDLEDTVPRLNHL